MNNKFIYDKIASLQLLSELKSQGLLNPLTAKLILSSHLAGRNCKEIEMLSDALKISNLVRGPFEIPNQDADGPIIIAYGENGQRIGFFPEECHALIVAMTGGGKTFLLKSIFKQALTLGIQIWLFAHATDLRDLIDIGKNILINKMDGTIKIGALNPINASRTDFTNYFSDILCQSESIYPGTKNYLIDRLNRLFKYSYEIPSLHHLFSFIQNDNIPYKEYRTRLYRDSALNRLGGILSGTLGKVFDCAVGNERELFNDCNCIFESNNITKDQQIFFSNLMTINSYKFRGKNKCENHLFIGYDDAAGLFDASYEKRSDFGMPILVETTNNIRKYGVNLFVCSQLPHKLISGIHANSAIKIMFKLGYGVDIDFMCKSIGNITPEQKDYFYQMEQRKVIIKNEIRYPVPILGTIPELPEARIVSDEEIKINNKRIIANFKPIIHEHQYTYQIKINEQKPLLESPITNHNEDKLKLLKTIEGYELKKMKSEIFKKSGFSSGKANRLYNQCVEEGLVKNIKGDGKGSPQFSMLTKDARKKYGLQKKEYYSKGASAEHFVSTHQLATRFSGETEFYNNGKHYDIGIKSTKGLLAIEVQRSYKWAKENLIKDINTGADFVILAATNKQVKTKIEKEISSLPEHFKNRSDVYLVSELLNADPSKILNKYMDK